MLSPLTARRWTLLFLLTGLWACSEAKVGEDTSGDVAPDTAPEEDAVPEGDAPEETTSDGVGPEDVQTTLDVNDPTGACGGVTGYGACLDQTTLQYCASPGEPGERLVTVDCLNEGTPNGVQGLCAFINDGVGFDCAATAGEECMFYEDGTETKVNIFCHGQGAGCVVDASPVGWRGRGTCQVNLTACEARYVCDGGDYIIDCYFGQPLQIDCAGMGGRCEDGCYDVPAGGLCDEAIGVYCAAGLTCSWGSVDGWGVCE